jgi:hypothetical protein
MKTLLGIQAGAGVYVSGRKLARHALVSIPSIPKKQQNKQKAPAIVQTVASLIRLI